MTNQNEYESLRVLVEESRQKAYNWEHDIEELLLTINALWKAYNHILEGK